jgi:3',5'-cyclic AMP phosphodiesterase CpdA
LRKAVAAVNSLERQPDFIMFTGDLTHAAADEKEALRR